MSKLYLGNCLEVMKKMEANIVDSVICDPPYGLNFMGKDWDYGVPGIAFWKEALRVAKPGAILMAFGGTRTVHRLACAIEDAGWEIRDRMQWLHGQGFPKSHNISKAMDKKVFVTCTECYGNKKKKNKQATDWHDYWLDEPCPECDGKGGSQGAEREVVGSKKLWGHNAQPGRGGQYANEYSGKPKTETITVAVTAPATPEAKLWDGWGTALKPAHEPIIVAMKPIEGTYVENALKWGVAGLWIDGGLVSANGEEITINTWDKGAQPFGGGAGKPFTGRKETKGRWPANILHDGSDEVLAEFPQSKGDRRNVHNDSKGGAMFGGGLSTPENRHRDSGSAARFFYCAKASKAERNAGLDGMEVKNLAGHNKWTDVDYRKGKGEVTAKPQQNHHPTVKPLKLMQYLCKLTKTPTGGIVLDPFMGSGTTGVACANTGREFIGIELDKDYFAIAEKRIKKAEQQPKLI